MVLPRSFGGPQVLPWKSGYRNTVPFYSWCFWHRLVNDLFTLGGQVDTYNILHGSIGGGNQSQNVVVNVTAPTMAPQVATEQTSAQQLTQASPTKISAEKAILALAEKLPVLTLRQIVSNANLEMEEAESAVKKLVAKGMAKEEVDSSGKSTYTFIE